ncbi:MAG: glycoside hydrolase family 9 protein [Candidatus Paceibacterota bacterium]|jgi:endoglucanase
MDKKIFALVLVVLFLCPFLVFSIGLRTEPVFAVSPMSSTISKIVLLIKNLERRIALLKRQNLAQVVGSGSAIEELAIWDGSLAGALAPTNFHTGGSATTTDCYNHPTCFAGYNDGYHAPAIFLNGMASWRKDLTGYDSLQFYAKSSQVGKKLVVSVYGWPSTSNTYQVDLGTSYQLFSIPVSALKGASSNTSDLKKIEAINFAPPSTNGSLKGYYVFVDGIKVVRAVDVAEPVITPPANPVATTSPTSPIANPPTPATTTTPTTLATTTVPKTALAPTFSTSSLPYTQSSVFYSLNIWNGDGPNDGLITTNGEVISAGCPSGNCLKGTFDSYHNIAINFTAGGNPLSRADLSNYDEIQMLVKSSDWSTPNNFTFRCYGNVGTTVSMNDFVSASVGDYRQVNLPVYLLKNSTCYLSALENLYFFAPKNGVTTQIDNIRAVKYGQTTPPLANSSENPASTLVLNMPTLPVPVLPTTQLSPASDVQPILVGATSDTVVFRWHPVTGAASYQIWLLPEPTRARSPKSFLLTTLSSEMTGYIAHNIGAGLDAFFEIRAIDSKGQLISSGVLPTKTVGGPLAIINSPLREVHLLAPKVLLLQIYNPAVYMNTSNWGESMSGYYGAKWQAGPWTITRADGTPITVKSVSRRSVPLGHGDGSANNNYVNVEHRLFLTLSEPVGSTEVLTVTGPYGFTSRIPFSDLYTETPVIQLNQVGYSPVATERYAYISYWLGDGGGLSLDDFPGTASVIRDSGNSAQTRMTIVDNLPLSLRSALDSDAGTAVKQINLASVPPAEAVVYRVRIPGVGVSWPTQVSYTGVFKSFYTIMRGMYYNRWGRVIALPWSDFPPRPADHPTVYNAEKATSGYGADAFFSPNTPKTTTRPLSGGHHDAGDFDQQITHWRYALDLLEAYELNPQSFTDGQLNIPESGNGVPDLLDEALYELRGWQQLQEADGGVRQGVESSAHPCVSCFADVDNTPFWTYSVDAGHTARIAGLFAQAARLIKPFTAAKSAELGTAAIRAFNYATSHGIGPGSGNNLVYPASQLSLLTGDANYLKTVEIDLTSYPKSYGHDNIPIFTDDDHIFISPGATSSTLSIGMVAGYINDPKRDGSKWMAPFMESKTDQSIGNILSNKLIEQHAHRSLRGINPPSWSMENIAQIYALDAVFHKFMTNSVDSSEKQKYLNAMSLAADYILGGNPEGMVWVSGLGSRYPTEPLWADALAYLSQKDGLLPGFAIFGVTAGIPNQPYYSFGSRVIYPSVICQDSTTGAYKTCLDNYPVMHRYWDIRSFVSHNEGGPNINALYAELLAKLLPGQPIYPPAAWLPGGADVRTTAAPRTPISSSATFSYNYDPNDYPPIILPPVTPPINPPAISTTTATTTGTSSPAPVVYGGGGGGGGGGNPAPASTATTVVTTIISSSDVALAKKLTGPFVIGSTSNQVKILQQLLTRLPTAGAGLKMTGRYDQATIQSVKNFQKQYAIKPVTGIAGPLTRTKLKQVFTKSPTAVNPNQAKINSLRQQLNILIQLLAKLKS